jgi:ERF superfamily.
MPGIQKDSVNPHYKNSYVSLEKLMEVVMPVLHENDCVLMQLPTTVGDLPALRTVILHVPSGDQVEDTMFLMLDKDNPQGQGSAITYARRYSLMSILGLVADEDDDGERASTHREDAATSSGW